MQSIWATLISLITSLVLTLLGSALPVNNPKVPVEPQGLVVKIATPSARLQPNWPDLESTIYSSTPTPSPSPSVVLTPTPTVLPWGTTEKLQEHIYRTYVGQDPALASPSEILEALNVYRKDHGRQTVSNDNKLCDLAKFRAEQQAKIDNLDEHKGLIEYLNDAKHWEDLGVKGLGENASWGYQLSGTHLIEWVFDADQEHRDNQLNPSWNRACVATSKLLVEILFADK